MATTKASYNAVHGALENLYRSVVTLPSIDPEHREFVEIALDHAKSVLDSAPGIPENHA